MTVLRGSMTSLREATDADVEALVRIRETPEVKARWRGIDIDAEVRESIADKELHFLAIEDGSSHVVGAIQWEANDDPEYPHASVDIFLDPAVHGRGLGTDAIRTLCTYLVIEAGFHRLVIDPSADNAAAIRCYEKVGFHRVGVMRAYERDLDGSFHDGLLMDLLADELVAGTG